MGDAEDDAEDGLAEHDQRQQAEPLRDVPRVDRRLRELPPREERRAELEDERDAPEPVAPRRRQRERGDPEAGRRAEGDEEDRRQPARLGDVPPRPLVEHEQDHAGAEVREREAGRAAVEDGTDRRREHGDEEHREQREQPVGQVVCVEAVRIEGEAHPQPPDRHEERDEAEEAREGRVRRERVRELADRGDEDEVEEELEPCRPPVVDVGPVCVPVAEVLPDWLPRVCSDAVLRTFSLP